MDDAATAATIPFWQSAIFAIAALTGGVSILSALLTLLAQNWFAERRRSADIARDDRLRNEDRTNAQQETTVRFRGELRGRLCDAIAAFIDVTNSNVATMRIDFLASREDRAGTPAMQAAMHPLFVALFNAHSAARRLDPSGTLDEAVDALKNVGAAFSELFGSDADTNDLGARAEAANQHNDELTSAMARLGDLVDAQRLKQP